MSVPYLSERSFASLSLDRIEVDPDAVEMYIAEAALSGAFFEVAALDAHPWAPVYLGPYPVRPEVRQALDERYGVGAWTHARGADGTHVRYLPSGASYARAIACARRPAYSPFDGKYSAARAQRFLMDLYAAGMVSERMLLDAFGLDVSGRPE